MKSIDYINKQIINNVLRDYEEDFILENVPSFNVEGNYDAEQVIKEMKEFLGNEWFEWYEPNLNYVVFYGNNHENDLANWTRQIGESHYKICSSEEEMKEFAKKVCKEYDFHHVFPIVSEDELY